MKTYRRSLAGVRPFKKNGIRVERETFGNKTIIHNYGHGGAGISLCPATAIEAALLIDDSTKKDVAILGSGIVGLFSAL